MTRAEAVRALVDTWTQELGDDAAHGVLFGILVARAAPNLAEIVERGLEEMLEDDTDAALANQAAREQFGEAVRDWLREQEVAA
jgi:hypothetical protein